MDKRDTRAGEGYNEVKGERSGEAGIEKRRSNKKLRNGDLKRYMRTWKWGMNTEGIKVKGARRKTG